MVPKTLSAAAVAAALIAGGMAACAPSHRPDRDGDRTFDAPPDPTGENVQVTVDIYEVDESERFVLEAAWRYAAEDADAEAVPAACRRNGLRVARGTASLAAELRAAAARARSCRRSKLFLTVLNGKTGLFQITEVLPAPVTLVLWDAGVARTGVVPLERPQAALEVRPERTGDNRIRLDLTPVVSSAGSDSGSFTLTQMRSSVVVPRGVPVVLGGLDQEGQTFGGAFFSARSARERRRRLLLVTAR